MTKKDYIYSYGEQEIPYTIWFTDDSAQVETIIFLGTVQINKIPAWVAENAPPRTAVVQGAPHWHAKPDGSDIPQYMFEFAESAFREIISNNQAGELNIIADSQAVPCVLQLFAIKEYEKYLKQLILLQPLGLNRNSFIGDSDQIIKIFKNRIVKNAYHQLTSLLLDGKLRYNHRLLTKTVSFRDPVAWAQYSVGLQHDSITELRLLHDKGYPVTIICGDKDRIFPHDEIRRNLSAANVDVDIRLVKGVPHSPLATAKGSRLLDEAYEAIAA